VCAWCGAVQKLMTHHLDHNRLNNDLSNLIVICRRCHQLHHVKRDSQGRFTTHT
jgi:hypothetical protein